MARKNEAPSLEHTAASIKDEAPALEHTAASMTVGGERHSAPAHTRDGMDAGVPMIPGRPDEPIGPEDALGAGPKRGDYSDRLVAGPSMVTRVIPESEREPDGPIYELVPAGTDLEVGDDPGKGGVTTAAARASAPVLAPTGPGAISGATRETPANIAETGATPADGDNR